MRRSLLQLAILAIAVPAHAGGGETIMPPPPTYEATGVAVEEHLGARLPADAMFRTVDNTVTTLGALLAEADTPVILTFNYSDCPLLCSMQLNGLTAAMPLIDEFRAGVHYRIVTISLNPDEQPHKLAAMRAKYLERLPEEQRAKAKAGWTFLVGDAVAIRRVADAVGFKYKYIADRAEWAHPAAFVFASTGGTVTRYVHGFELAPDVFRESIIKAGMSEPATAAGFAHLCYFFDPDAKNHSRAGVLALRIGAAGFVVLLAGLGMVFLIRRKGPTP
jgi:protein SCO1/2